MAEQYHIDPGMGDDQDLPGDTVDDFFKQWDNTRCDVGETLSARRAIRDQFGAAFVEFGGIAASDLGHRQAVPGPEMDLAQTRQWLYLAFLPFGDDAGGFEGTAQVAAEDALQWNTGQLPLPAPGLETADVVEGEIGLPQVTLDVILPAVAVAQ